MDSTLLEMLELFGLDTLEAQVYLSTLKARKGTAYEISKELKTRTSVYTVLEKLKQKGLVHESTKMNKKIYEAKDIMSFVEEKRSETEIVAKNIITLSSHLMSVRSTGIKIFKGEDQLKEGLRYGIHKGNDEEKKIFCIYPSSSKITISPKDTLYYNFNVTLSKYNYKKIIISDVGVRSEYRNLDQELGFVRHMYDLPILKDISKMAIGVEIIEDGGIIKILFYKENMVLVVENKELSDFLISYLKIFITSH